MSSREDSLSGSFYLDPGKTFGAVKNSTFTNTGPAIFPGMYMEFDGLLKTCWKIKTSRID
jgi:hypothetical protein